MSDEICQVHVDLKVDLAALYANRSEGYCKTHDRPFSECPQPMPPAYPSRGRALTHGELAAIEDEPKLRLRLA